MDRRDRATCPWYSSFNERAMTITLNDAIEEADDHEFTPFVGDRMYCDVCGCSETDHTGTHLADLVLPAVYAVCPTCDGRGSHVRPGIDAHGISPEEFAEDPDFAEAYFRGDYDQPCVECGGRRVVPEVDDARLTPAARTIVHAWQAAHTEVERDYAAERRMGA